MVNIQKNILKRLVIIGGGSAGIGVIASIKKRTTNLSIILIEPQEQHFYQPAWTLVGRGLLDVEKTYRPMNEVIPPGVSWVKDSVLRVFPDNQMVETTLGEKISYDYLIVACGLTLRWDKIAGIQETLGRNGVTSNYRFDLASYTWELVKKLQNGNALFCQPSMPIKCAGAPQKAMYLSCDHWQRTGVLRNIKVSFCLAGQVVFGVPTFVPPLKSYLEKYGARVNYCHNLIRVDGERKLATFAVSKEENIVDEVTLPFDMLHVVPPQSAPEFIQKSGLGDINGWCDVDKCTLQHQRWPNIFSLGDCCSAPNSKTLAAARKQIVVVAENICHVIRGKAPESRYDGYGSCPLTVELGKVVLAEFGYDNKLMPTFPFNATKPNRFAWWLTVWFLPHFYWAGILRGVEWFTKCKR